MIDSNFVYTPEKAMDNACWQFCQERMKAFNIDLPDQPTSMKKLKAAKIPCIVLFYFMKAWHSGIVEKDGLHFTHAKPEEKDGQVIYRVRNERLTAWPWKKLVEGFYEIG